jgi:short-subunit dehydrogenase involved in D-alanine esterification of teichoic acids
MARLGTSRSLGRSSSLLAEVLVHALPNCIFIKSRLSIFILISPPSLGIGLALAKLCHSHGARVLVGDLKLVPEAQKFVDSTPGSEVAFQKCDVSSWASLHELITTSVRQFGIVPDVYVPCAGVFEPPWSNFWDDTEKETYKVCLSSSLVFR